MLDVIALRTNWASERLEYSIFQQTEASLLKSIFEANSHLDVCDPTFGLYPGDEYISLVKQDSNSGCTNADPSLNVRKVSLEGVPIGYFQIELDRPEPGMCWLPMMVFLPAQQRFGFGAEAFNSLVPYVPGYLSPLFDSPKY